MACVCRIHIMGHNSITKSAVEEYSAVLSWCILSKADFLCRTANKCNQQSAAHTISGAVIGKINYSVIMSLLTLANCVNKTIYKYKFKNNCG